MHKIVFILFFLSLTGMNAQNNLLAENYFEQGEYEKALTLYTQLYKKNKYFNYFKAIVASHQQLEEYKEAEKLLKGRLNIKIIPQLYVELGYNYSLQENDSLATINYNKAILFVKESEKFNYGRSIGESFERYSLLDKAIETYLTAMDVFPDTDYSYQLARLYGEQGNLEKMFDSYLVLIKKKRSYQGVAQQNFSLYISEDPAEEANILLRKVLLQKLQKQSDVLYNELLSWLFIQQKEYKKAFTQEKAIYKRMGNNDMSGIADIAYFATNDDDDENAILIVNFVIDNASTPKEKIEGYQQLMKIKLKTASKKEYPKIKKSYEDLFNEFGSGKETHQLQLDYNYFLGFQNNEKDLAVSNLKSFSKQPLSQYQEARIKMLLADILVFDEKFNQALIYYSQIQHEVKGNLLAQEARFKVAKTSYFNFDFAWAQLQLDVLKKSATQLIANDAMQLSLLIKDNSIEDSTQTALKQFARADLLTFQKKETEAISVLKNLLENHKGEKIEDEALLKLGELYETKGEYEKAAESYLALIQFYNEDILADDAHYRLAKLYETKLNQPQKAKEYYELLIFNFVDSIYFVEARKKYRMLRGDEIE
ncbi:MAG: tetratricopeptide repeat protein [Flavobacteriaceae bacterium]|nr:tetratricopeptide repeat protein [Flavobacteriaceae bacterium]MBT6706244.1 tetratricopeptide repeat protein [Flavobacteriaceae bacterium]MBT7243253.1 tetratricopeptide repeat protein [Flavobacteriaceae bacterium]